VATAVEPGAVIDGKYRVVRRIGEGGMGTVYEGENIRIERRVAIKVLHAHVASTPEFAQRFEREARASARIGSPHVCDVLDLGDLTNGERFIVMEFLDGESLEDRLEQGTLTAAQLAPIAFEILEGLGTMHQAGVIHRDLKPANVFLAKTRGKPETVKILDFGVAKILPRADEPSAMTSTGMMMGTPLYMSPEQARGARDVDGRTDLYAASVIFYRALTGQVPHSGDNLHELLFKIVLEDPRPIRELAPDVDEAFAEIITRGLARDPDQRFSSAREYQEHLAAWGAAQGRASLAFALTLSSEPPPLKSLSGGYPVAKIPTSPITGPQPREKVGPPTPALAKTQADTAMASPSPSVKQSGGTPIVWSEDAPEIAKRAMAELEAKKQRDAAAKAASAQAESSATSPPASIESRPGVTPSSAPSTTPAPRKSRVTMLIAGAAALVAVAIGVRVATQAPAVAATTNAPPTGVTQAPSAQDPLPAASSATPVASALVAEPTPTTSASTAAPRTTAGVAAAIHPAATPKNAAPVSASAAKSAAPTASTAAAPAPTTSARKFRTNLE
jgi:eukaryotic-like serine/threonine-protein kinase